MTPSVLIVDDSLTVRMDLEEALLGAGFRVVLCADAAAARRALASDSFDLLLLDVLLPDGSGLDLLRDVRGDPRTAALATIVLSGETEVADRIRGLENGADDYIGKPYSRPYLIARARELVRRQAGGASHDASRLVLVIDDSATACHEICEALQQVGYAVVSAPSGEEGLRVAVDRRPAAIIADGVLPGMDGPAVVRQIRGDAILRRTPCIVLTGSDRTIDELHALDEGADAYLRKEDGLEVVVARLRALLRSGPAATLEGASVLGPKRVLAVDHSPTYLQELNLELRLDGYEAILSNSGEEALQLLAVQRVDCVLVDLMMPAMSGQQLCAAVKSSTALSDIPLIILTAREEREAMLQGIEAGADDYVHKSSGFAALRARVKAQLRRAQFAQENRAIHDQQHQRDLEAAEARAAKQLAETRAALLRDLEAKNEELQRADEAKNEFLAMLSHELRNPLAPIRNSLYILDRVAPGGEQAVRAKAVIDRQVAQLSRLVDDLLDVTRIQRNKIQLRRERVELNEVVTRTAEDFRSLFEQNGVTLEMAPATAPIFIDADGARIGQVVGNLLHNAAKFTRRGDRTCVSVAAGTSRNRAIIHVRDTGIGIAPGVVSTLFEPFVQADRTLDRSKGGLGLGLALVKGLVELHGGEVTVRSDGEGHGAEFVVSLPTSEPRA